MKKLLIIFPFLSTILFAEPSDWVRRELINKPVTYMTFGLHRCTEKFAKDQNAKSPATCEYDWKENRLIFLQTDTSVQDNFDSNDFNAALKHCTNNLQYTLKTFSDGRARFLRFYLRGFLPDGYSYPDNREEKLEEFTKRSLVVYQIIHKDTDTDGTVWLCEWKYNEPEPSIRKGPPY